MLDYGTHNLNKYHYLFLKPSSCFDVSFTLSNTSRKAVGRKSVEGQKVVEALYRKD